MKKILFFFLFTFLNIFPSFSMTDEENYTEDSNLEDNGCTVTIEPAPKKESRRTSKYLLQYQQSIEDLNSLKKATFFNESEVNNLKNSSYSQSIPKLERVHSQTLTVEERITREHLSSEILAQDIFFLTHLLENRLILAMGDPNFESHSESLKALRQRTCVGYMKAHEFAQQAASSPSYYQDYASFYQEEDTSLKPQAFLNISCFMITLLEAELYKNQVKEHLEKGFFQRIDESNISVEIKDRNILIRKMAELRKTCLKSLYKYPYNCIYGQKISKNIYLRRSLLSFKENIERLTQDKKKEKYYGNIKFFLEEIVGEIEQEIKSLETLTIDQSHDDYITTQEIEIQKIDNFILEYWNNHTRIFTHDKNISPEEILTKLAQAVEIFESCLIESDPISYDPLNIFKFNFKVLNPYWTECQIYIHFIQNTDNSGGYDKDNREAFNPFVFLPLDEIECRFLKQHNCARGKLKLQRDFLKKDAINF